MRQLFKLVQRFSDYARFTRGATGPACQPKALDQALRAPTVGLILGLSMRTKRPSACWSSMNEQSGNPAPDPWIAKVLFGALLTVLVISEAVLFSGIVTIPESWPLG